MSFFRRRCISCRGTGVQTRCNGSIVRAVGCLTCGGRGSTAKQWPWILLMILVTGIAIYKIEGINPYLTRTAHRG